jgi:hypothetical protein
MAISQTSGEAEEEVLRIPVPQGTSLLLVGLPEGVGALYTTSNTPKTKA